MGNRNKLIDEYIEKAAPFAKPILSHIRELIHEAWPEIEETIKWKVPVYEYKGIVCATGAFKTHCAFNFFKAKLMKDPYHVFSEQFSDAAGQFGKLLTVSDLPSDSILREYIQEAAKLNTDKIKGPAKKKEDADHLIPNDLSIALKNNPIAQKQFETMSLGYKKEYIDWLLDAKMDATRQKRLETAIEWIAEGKPRNWKYMKK